MRIPITRHDSDGSTIEGTAEMERTDVGLLLQDFRDVNGVPMDLPRGSSFQYVWPDPPTEEEA